MTIFINNAEARTMLQNCTDSSYGGSCFRIKLASDTKKVYYSIVRKKQ